jgi:hypothetical protein
LEIAMEKKFEVSSMGGVVDVDQPAGTVTVVRGEAATHVDLHVDSGDGNEALVHLGYTEIVQLMVALGAAAESL